MVSVLTLGTLPSPSQGTVWAGQHLGSSGATLVGFGFPPVSADWAWADPGVHLGVGVCVLGHLLLLTMQMLLSVWWCGLDTGMVQTAFPLGDTESQSSISCFALGKAALCPSKQVFFSLGSPFSVLWTWCCREDEPLVRQEGWIAARVGLVHLGDLFQPQ